MLGKVGYALRETLANLRRNLLLTSASMLTVAVSLSLVGAAFLLRYGVDNATQRWQGGVEFEVFLNPDATPEQTGRIEQKLLESADVDRATYVSQSEQYEYFQVLFANRPEYLNVMTVEKLPPSYRVEPAVESADADIIRALGDRLEGEPGVYEVAFAEDAVRTLLQVSNVSQIVIFSIAAILLFAAALLIFNTIRMAIFARRREIEVMKLVGATNWFIRVPFMIEGMVQGLFGAGLAFAVVYLGRGYAEQAIREVQVLENFAVLNSQVATTGVLTLVIGAAIGTIGAGVAVTKFLDV
jgi:cell division transport system permease protein